MMRSSAFLLLFAAGCGGAPFASDDTATTSAVDPAPDASPHQDASALDASPLDASPLDADASPKTTPEAAAAAFDSGACAPFVWTPPADGSAAGPFGPACVVGSSPDQIVPSSYAVVLTTTNGCFLEPTPADCICAYRCDCLLAHKLFCSGAELVGCADEAGAPVVTCQ